MTLATRDHPIYLAALAQAPSYPGGPRYITTTDTARLVRATLKARWPAVRFSVRSESYSGGSSIDVWYDGLDHYAPLTSCFCPDGPTIRNDYGANQCGKCAYMRPLEPIYKPGAPTQREVENALGAFSGSRFDGMIDMSYNVKSWLNPDGSATLAESAGTGGQRGSDPGYSYSRETGGALLVHFCASYVFVRHDRA